MKTLTPEERGRRASVLGITLPAPPAAAPRPKLTLKKPPAVAPPPPKPEPPLPVETKQQRYQAGAKCCCATATRVFAAAGPWPSASTSNSARRCPRLAAQDLRLFLSRWVHRDAYRAALARGDRRVNLDGTDAGPAFDEPGTTDARTPSLGEPAPPPAPAPCFSASSAMTRACASRRSVSARSSLARRSAICRRACGCASVQSRDRLCELGHCLGVCTWHARRHRRDAARLDRQPATGRFVASGGNLAVLDHAQQRRAVATDRLVPLVPVNRACVLPSARSCIAPCRCHEGNATSLPHTLPDTQVGA